MAVTPTVSLSLNFPAPLTSSPYSSFVSCVDPFGSVHFGATRSLSGDQHSVDFYHHSPTGLDPHSEVRDLRPISAHVAWLPSQHKRSALAALTLTWKLSKLSKSRPNPSQLYQNHRDRTQEPVFFKASQAI